MSARNLAVLVAGLGLTLGVAACGAEGGAAAAPAATATTAAAPAVTASASTSAPAVAAGPACPVTEADLQKSVTQPDPNGVTSKSTFTKIVCFKDHAVATVPERTDSDEGYATFKYASGAWTFLGTATADICVGFPADVVEHFDEAGYGACR